MHSPHITAILPAAGIGKRMQPVFGQTRKQFIQIHGRPLLCYTLDVFQKSDVITDIVLVCEKEWIGYVGQEIISKYNFDKVKKIIEGGAQRQDSVYNGLRAIDKTDLVMVHDAVRPMATEELIQRSAEACMTHQAVITAVRVKDTIKLQNPEQFVAETIDRSNLWQVQTPQCFDYALLKQAFEKAYADSFYGTDESMLVERLGHPVKIIEGDYRNVKITTPDDVALAQLYLPKPE